MVIKFMSVVPDLNDQHVGQPKFVITNDSIETALFHKASAIIFIEIDGNGLGMSNTSIYRI